MKTKYEPSKKLTKADGTIVSGAQGILSVEKFVSTDEWDNIHGDMTHWG